MNAANAVRHLVLIAVFDGLRPDFVRPEWTPRLWALREEGVWFARSHCVFPSVTRVNAASLVTGSFPIRHGIDNNSLWRPAIDAGRPLNTGVREDLLRLEAARGRMLAAPTLGEALAAAGGRMVAAGSGSSGGTALLHPLAAATKGAVLHHTFSVPAALDAAVRVTAGEPHDLAPGLSLGEQALRRVRWSMRALTNHLLPAYRPAVAVLWCTVPDGLEHRYGLGSPPAMAALAEADAAFGDLLDRIDAAAPYDAVDVIVTADHGYATVAGRVDPRAALIEAGLVPDGRERGFSVRIHGGAVSFDGDLDWDAVADFLLGQAWVAALFSPAGRVQGTLPLEAAGVGGPDAPVLLCCLAWDDEENEHRAPGRSLGGGGIAVGGGDHGGLSAWEMRNTLIAHGPGFARGLIADAPCGIVDIAPTALHLLGLPVPAAWQGRVLAEAFAGGAAVGGLGDEEIGAGDQVLCLERAAGVRYPTWARRPSMAVRATIDTHR